MLQNLPTPPNQDLLSKFAAKRDTDAPMAVKLDLTAP